MMDVRVTSKDFKMDENLISADDADLLAMTTDIVVAFASNNAMSADDLPDLIESVFRRMQTLGEAAAEPEVEDLVPAVPIKKSVTRDYIICLEDGKKLKMLRRHLSSAFGMTPEQYREKWGLKPDYPMVAPAYAELRQELAKKIGLGKKGKGRPRKAKV